MTSGIVIFDIHGMTKYQAENYLDNQLKMVHSSVYHVKVIHGFHGGTQLREMVRNTYAYHPKVKRIDMGANPGETILILREL